MVDFVDGGPEIAYLTEMTMAAHAMRGNHHTVLVRS